MVTNQSLNINLGDFFGNMPKEKQEKATEDLRVSVILGIRNVILRDMPEKYKPDLEEIFTNEGDGGLIRYATQYIPDFSIKYEKAIEVAVQAFLNDIGYYD